jgi:hypothetical protein
LNEEPNINGHLEQLLGATGFSFRQLAISGIDNNPVFARHGEGLRKEETCLFHESAASGDDYVALLAERIETAIAERRPFPVVRFADGEYTFYSGSLQCNGLYRQAESVAAIQAAIPGHMRDIHYLSEHGILAPLIFPGNVHRLSKLRSLFGRKNGNDSALHFLELLAENGLRLSALNYVPFYAVYAYLSGARFARAVDGKTVCIVNSDFNAAACADWFARAGSHPKLVHVPISDSYVATRWNAMRDNVLRSVPEHPDCFMVGAGIGALQVCTDMARHFSVPAIDSGHILNMMNDLERKSQGPRLFTYRR